MLASKMKLLMGIGGIAVGFVSCQKDNLAKTQNNTLLTTTTARETAKIEPDGLATKLTLIPDATDGQDTYVSKIIHDKNDGNANQNFTHEIVMGTWPFDASRVAVERSYIRFDSLSKVPLGSRIVSATLYLYGERSSIVFPNGNSFYPGGHAEDNSCEVDRVTGGTWDQTTLTWNNMPRFTRNDSAIIAASTTEWHYNASADVTAMVKTMLNTGQNYGFCIKLITEAPYRDLLFSTSESDSPNLRPKLVVRYK